jgi:hypothetical protein
MSKRADGLIADELDNRWMVTEMETNVTVIASVAAPQSAKSTNYLDSISWTIANMNALGCTITASVRDVSLAGTVLAQWRLFVPGSTTAQVNPANIVLKATRGAAMHFVTDTVVGSVTASLNACGWIDASTN